ncbi:Protein O-glucosyltransferase 2 [Chamberlinius hualienensis]
MFAGLVFVALVGACSAFYDKSSGVVDLNPSNFDKLVLQGDGVWIVEFFAPWCGHCQSLVPEYTKAAKALKGVVNVGAVNADEHKSLGGEYKIKGFPTIKIFSANKRTPEDYNGGRTAQELIDAGLKAAKQLVESRSKGKSGGSSDRTKESDSKHVIELTDENFKKLVLESDDMWLVEFFAPWCGHCKNLAPHWATAATELKGKVKLGALDATVHTITAGKYGIKGYPTIKYFPAGKKDGTEVDYDGGRTASDIVQWATEKVTENVPPPEVHQIISKEVLEEGCKEHQLCIISVLPHILDCQSKCRNDYLNVLRQLGERFKKNMWGWLWVEAGSQLELEENLGIGGFGYPAMAAVNSRKARYALLRGSFSLDGIGSFLKELAYGKASTIPFKGNDLPKVVATEPWDGKDGHLDVEEPYSDDDLKDEL